MKVATICKKLKLTEIVLMRYVQTNTSMMCQTTGKSTRTLSAMLTYIYVLIRNCILMSQTTNIMTTLNHT